MSTKGLRVLLHIYEPAKGGPSFPGFGVYHTGIEIGDNKVEYCYAGAPGAPGSGIQHMQATVSPDPDVWKFKESVELGRTSKTAKEVSSMLDIMSKDWAACDYDVVHNNCNHFTQAVVDRLNESNKSSSTEPLKYPGYINRAARFGSFFMDNPIADRKKKEEKRRQEEEKKKNPFLNSKGHTLGGSSQAKAINQTGAAVPTTSSPPSESTVKQTINQSSGPKPNPWRDEKFVQQRLGKK